MANLSAKLIMTVTTFILISTNMFDVTHSAAPVDVSPNSTDSADVEEPLSGRHGLQTFFGKRGGVIRLYRNIENSTKGGGKTGEISVFIDSIQEVDSAGQKVTGGGSHAITQFNQVQFKTSVSRNYSLPHAVSPAEGIFADCLLCNGSLSAAGGSGSMLLSVCTILNNGTLSQDNETTTLTAGQLKLSLSISSWQWSGSSAYLDVDMIVKLPPGRNVRNNTKLTGKPVRFSLGADATSDFSSKVFNDNVWWTMSDSYPLFTQKGANNVITIRLPKSSGLLTYDPSFEVGSQLETADPVTTQSSTSQAGAVGVIHRHFLGLTTAAVVLAISCTR